MYFLFFSVRAFSRFQAEKWSPELFPLRTYRLLTSKHRDFKHLVFIQRFRSTFCVLLGRKGCAYASCKLLVGLF